MVSNGSLCENARSQCTLRVECKNSSLPFLLAAINAEPMLLKSEMRVNSPATLFRPSYRNFPSHGQICTNSLDHLPEHTVIYMR